MRKLWVDILDLGEFQPTSRHRICSKHFRETCLVSFNIRRQVLKPGSVPRPPLDEYVDTTNNKKWSGSVQSVPESVTNKKQHSVQSDHTSSVTNQNWINIQSDHTYYVTKSSKDYIISNRQLTDELIETKKKIASCRR